MVSVLTSIAVDHGFEISVFSIKHVPLRSNNKDLLAWNQEIVPEWSDVFRQKNPTKHVRLVQSRHHHTRNVSCSQHDI